MMSLDQHGVIDADEEALAFGDRFQAASTGQPDLSAHHTVAPVFNEAEVVPIDQVEEARQPVSDSNLVPERNRGSPHKRHT
jgi:hypothetical protein